MTSTKQKKKNNINHKSSANIDLTQLFPKIDEWPESWAGFECDIPVGEVILKEFKLFLNEQQGRLAKKTLKDYGNYLWALGGEIIRDINLNEIKEKEKDISDGFLLNYVDEFGGPHWRHATSEKDHDRYDSICRCFYKYLISKK